MTDWSLFDQSNSLNKKAAKLPALSAAGTGIWVAKAEVYMLDVRSEGFPAKLKRRFAVAQAVGRVLACTLATLRRQPSDQRPLPFAQLGLLLPNLLDGRRLAARYSEQHSEIESSVTVNLRYS
jgi:hypothetical protein